MRRGSAAERDLPDGERLPAQLVDSAEALLEGLGDALAHGEVGADAVDQGHAREALREEVGAQLHYAAVVLFRRRARRIISLFRNVSTFCFEWFWHGLFLVR